MKTQVKTLAGIAIAAVSVSVMSAYDFGCSVLGGCHDLWPDTPTQYWGAHVASWVIGV